MIDLHHASSHRAPKRVHRARQAACALVLLAACRPSGAGLGGATGTGTDTGGAEEPLWSFGDDDLVILSSPVVDAVGNMFVVAGTDAQPIQEPPLLDQQLVEYFDVSSIVLISVSPAGVERWTRALAPAQVVGKQARWRPAVGSSGDVWTCWNTELRRWGNDGVLRWSAPDRCHGPDVGAAGVPGALAGDGTFYAVVEVPGDPEPGLMPELRATAADGEALWSRVIGDAHISQGEDSEIGTSIGGLAVAADGRVISGCDTCVMGENAVAVFAPSDGAPTALYSAALNPMSTDGLWYSAPVPAGDVTWIAIEGLTAPALYAVHADGEADVRDGGLQPPLVGDDAIAHRDYYNGVYDLLWNSMYLDPDALPGKVVGPVALLHSAQLLVGYSGDTWVGSGCYDACGLFVVDAEGAVVWQLEGVAPGFAIPVVGEGYLVYVDDEYRLVKRSAPVEGLADGPWPVVGGDPQGTRSAEGK